MPAVAVAQEIVDSPAQVVALPGALAAVGEAAVDLEVDSNTSSEYEFLRKAACLMRTTCSLFCFEKGFL